MANVVRNPYSNTAGNTPSSLGNGVLAVNQADGRLFYRSGAGAVTTFSSIASFATTASFPAVGLASVLYLASDTSRLHQFVGGVYVEVGVAGGGIATTSASGLVDGTLADARLSANVVLTGDGRLSDSRSPTSHASSHASGGADALTLAASQIVDGTLADARLSSNVPRLENLASWASQPSTAIETFPRSHLVFSGSLLVSGQVIFVFFTPLVTTTVSQISMGVVSTAASGLTLARMGLFTFNESTATLVARTASDTTLFTQTRTVYTRSFDSSSGGFPATYTLTAGTRYGVGVIAVGATMPLLSGTTPPFEIASLPPKLSAARSGQSDLGTIGSLGTTSAIPYARLS